MSSSSIQSFCHAHWESDKCERAKSVTATIGAALAAIMVIGAILLILAQKGYSLGAINTLSRSIAAYGLYLTLGCGIVTQILTGLHLAPKITQCIKKESPKEFVENSQSRQLREEYRIDALLGAEVGNFWKKSAEGQEYLFYCRERGKVEVKLALPTDTVKFFQSFDHTRDVTDPKEYPEALATSFSQQLSRDALIQSNIYLKEGEYVLLHHATGNSIYPHIYVRLEKNQQGTFSCDYFAKENLARTSLRNLSNGYQRWQALQEYGPPKKKLSSEVIARLNTKFTMPTRQENEYKIFRIDLFFAVIVSQYDTLYCYYDSKEYKQTVEKLKTMAGSTETITSYPSVKEI